MSLSRHSNMAKKNINLSAENKWTHNQERGEKLEYDRDRLFFFLSLVDVIHYLMVLET